MEEIPQIELLRNPFVIIPCLIVVVWDFIAWARYFKWVKAGDKKQARRVILLKPLSTIVCIFFVFTQIGGGFFIGTPYIIGSFLITVISLIFFIISIIRNRIKLGFPHKQYLFNIVIGFLMVVSIAVPDLLYHPIKESCTAINRPAATIIINAMDRYYQDHGKYTNNYEVLVPDYLPAVPKLTCRFIAGLPSEYTIFISYCEGDQSPRYWVHTIDFVGFDYYRQDGSYYRIGSFLDGGSPSYCPLTD